MSTTNLSFLCVVLFAAFVSGRADVYNRQQLIHQVIDQYDKLAFPENIDGTPLSVKIDFTVYRIVDLDNQVLTLDGFLSLSWKDAQLKWNPEGYDGITAFRLPSSLIWKPDIMLYNSAEEYKEPNGNINVIILSDGSVFYIPPLKTKSFCNVKQDQLKPNDTISCTLKFASWTYDELAMNILHGTHDQQGIDLTSFDSSFNQEWQLTSTSVVKNLVTYSCCVEPYGDITYTFNLTYQGKAQVTD